MQVEQIQYRDLQIRAFGRKGVAAPVAQRSNMLGDLKLFALTFAGGFLFMSLYLA